MEDNVGTTTCFTELYKYFKFILLRIHVANFPEKILVKFLK